MTGMQVHRAVTPAGIGAAPLWYNAKKNPFGASLVGDGTTNDQPAFAAMVAAVGASGGGAIYCPAGVYSIADHGTYWKSGVSLIGDGPGRTIFKLSNSGTGLPISLALHVTSLSQASFANPLVDCQFRDFEIDCSGMIGAYHVGMKPLNLQFMIRPRFENLYIHDSPASGIGCDFLLDGVMHRCVIERAGRLNDGTGIGSGGFGIGVGGYPDLNLSITDAVFVSGSDVLYSPSGAFPTSNWSSTNLPLLGASITSAGNVAAGTTVAEVVDATHLRMSAVASASDTGATATVAAQNSYEHLNTVISSCVSRDSGKHGAFFEAQSTAATYPVSKGCKIVDSSFTGNRYGVSDWGCDGLIIANCNLSNNSHYGFNVGAGVAGTAVAGRNGHVHNCKIQGNTEDGVRFNNVPISAPYRVTDCRISGNGATGAGGHGVHLYGTNAQKYVFINRNVISGNGGAGIRTAPVVDNSQFRDNTITDNGQNAGMDATQRVGISIATASSGLTISGNRIHDTQGTKTQQNALYYEPSGNPSGWSMVGNNGIGNAATTNGIGADAPFAFPNVTASASGRVGGNAASRMRDNAGLNGSASVVTVGAGATPASGTVYRVGAQPEDLWFTISGGTMTGLKIGLVALPGLSGGVTSYGPISCDPNDGITPTYTGTLTITARSR